MCGVIEDFSVRKSMHQGSALDLGKVLLYLFPFVMDKVTKGTQ